MKSLKVLVAVVVLFTISSDAMAQDYQTGLGLRGGYPSGITLKHFFAQKSAMEGVLSFGWGGIGITGLYELHNRIQNVEGLTWYYGGGAHFATANTDKQNPFESDYGSKIFLGVDGIVGLEYTFDEAPINISLDILPILNVIESPGIWFNAGLSVRYTFK